jgi:triacylglycerol esterase/lipase EstA (alpha/beta hydrolase family)
MRIRHSAIGGARAALLALVLIFTLIAPGVRPAAAQAANPPLLTGKLTYIFSGRADGDHSHHYQDDQVTVQVRLRWDEEANSYQDAGSAYTYTGSYSRRQFDTEDLFGMISEGTGAGGGQVGDRIGAHIIDDEGPVRLLALSVDRLPYRTTGTVTMVPANETIEVSEDTVITPLCDDRNWLIGREVAGQPGSFSMACSVNIAEGNATTQTIVSGILSAPGAKPQITGVRFEQQDVATGEWAPFAGNPGTVDGNQVRVIATVENGGGSPYNLPVRFLDGESLQQLPDGSVDLALNPGQIVEVTYQWDTEGWGWERPATPNAGARPNRTVEVHLGSDAVLYDSWSEPIVVRAKPVFLVHGLNSNAATWEPYAGLLREVNPTWRAFAVPGLLTGEDLIRQQRSVSLLANARAMHEYIEKIRRQEQAWHVDIVAHSMGGLISRQYIQSFMPVETDEDTPDPRPVVKHLVMLGTPNRGSLCASESFLMNLWTSDDNLLAPFELMPESVARFNQRVVDAKGAAFSVLAGTGTPYACNPFEGTSSDGVVLVTSAHHSYGDVGLTESNHIQMTGSRADFLAWVRPHLVGPASAAPQLAAPRLDQAPLDQGDLQVAQVLSVTLAPGESRDLALPVRDGQRLIVLFRAAPGVAASLRDPSGAEAGASPAGAPIQELRSIGVENPAPGAWTLRLSSQEQAPATVTVQLRLGEPELRAHAELTGSGEAQGVRLTLLRGAAPATGATVRARALRADGLIAEVDLVDDGLHDDGAAGDGVYGAAPGALGGRSLALVAHAAIGGEERFALAVAPDGGESRIYLPLLRQ